jgi:hypothetical protein
VLVFFGGDGSGCLALKAVELHGLVLTELELGFQVGAALVAVIVRITHVKDFYNMRRPCSSLMTTMMSMITIRM